MNTGGQAASGTRQRRVCWTPPFAGLTARVLANVHSPDRAELSGSFGQAARGTHRRACFRFAKKNLVGTVLALVGVTALGRECTADVTSRPSSSSERLLRLAGPGFQVLESSPFVIAYDTPRSAVDSLVNLGHETRNAVLRFCRGAELPIGDGSETLSIIVFDDYETFQKFALQHDRRIDGGAGWYHRDLHLSFFASTAAHPLMRPLSDRLNELEIELARRAPGDLISVRAIAGHIMSLRRQEEAIARYFNQFVFQHEVAHHVLFDLEVHDRSGSNPPWLVEGLACQFEVAQPDPRGRLSGVNPMRLADLRDLFRLGPDDRTMTADQIERAAREGHWVPMHRLVSDGDAFAGAGGGSEQRYAQAWGLVYFLHNHKREAFAGYLQELMSRSVTKSASSNAPAVDFRRFFGQPDAAFERALLDTLLALPFMSPRDIPLTGKMEASGLR